MTSTTGSRNTSSISDNGSVISPRKPIVALLLSFCPGLGQQYSGRLVRGIGSYMFLVIISWVAAIGYMYVSSALLGLLLLSVPFVGVTLIGIDAYFCAKRQPKHYRLKWYNRYWIYVLVFLALLVTVNPLMDYLVGDRIVRALFVTSDSMSPAVLDRDLVVINKLATPSRGDIVLVKFGDNNNRKSVTRLIKDQVLRRVIATAGDSIEVRGRQVYLNGQKLEEKYTSYGDQDRLNPLIMPDYHMEPLVVPSGSYFVLSDARQYGFDSRVFGLISDDEIDGVATKVFWSWNLDQGHFQWARTAMRLK